MERHGFPRSPRPPGLEGEVGADIAQPCTTGGPLLSVDKVEVGVRVGFVAQREVPPFLRVRDKPLLAHQAL